MKRGIPRSAWTVGPALLGFAVAFAQRPGETITDTRIELSADPGLFLHRVASVWSSAGDLGHVQSGQFVGYLFPMAPWFALGDWVGLPDWVVQRVWFGGLLAIGAIGVVRLMDALWSRERGIAHAGAALLYVLNPYVVIYASRGTVPLATSAVLPWLVLLAHRGLEQPRRWAIPAAFGVIVGLAGGGVNAAVLVYALIGPAALVAYEVGALRRPRGHAWALAWRTALCVGVASAWWVIPLGVQALYGEDFLSYTETPGTIWGTTSLSESLRSLGFWVMYIGTGFSKNPEASMAVARTYLFQPLVVLATFLVPLAALGGGLRLAARWRYAAFFGLLAVAALLVMAAGFPEGTPLRKGLTFAYNHVKALDFLRTTYKAAPLLVLALACLAGAGAASLPARFRPHAAVALLLLGAGFALPLVRGQAVDRELAYGKVPSYWKEALREADERAGERYRSLVLPGQLFGSYRWGETLTSVAPAIAKKPLAVREVVPYADRRSAQLLATTDDLVQQGRLTPDQLPSLLRLMGVNTVLVAHDSRRRQSGGLDSVGTEAALAQQSMGFAGHGPSRLYRPASGRGGTPDSLPPIWRSGAELAGESEDAPGASDPFPLVRVEPRGGRTLLDGDADGVAELAAHGSLSSGLTYAGDLRRGELRAALQEGARLVISDSARKRVLAPSRLRLNHGPTLPESSTASADSVVYDLFPGRGDAGKTVAGYTGLKKLEAPLSPGYSLYPEHRPFAALDGRLDTSWLADPNLDDPQRRVDLELDRPRSVPFVRVHPHSDRKGTTTKLGLSVNGGDERVVAVSPGWNRIPAGTAPLSSLSIRIAGVKGPKEKGGGGLDEVEIPGMRVRESLRLPTALAREARGADLSGNQVDVVLARTTADFPYRAGRDRTDPQQRSPLRSFDAEPGMERDVTLPVARAFVPSGWASVAPLARDSEVDRLAGGTGAWRLDSSSRFEGVPASRASSAFDRDPATAWVGDALPGSKPWLELGAPRPVTVRSGRLVRTDPAYSFPSRISITPAPAPTPGHGLGRSETEVVRAKGPGVDPRRAVEADVDRRGRFRLPAPVRAHRFRITMERLRRSTGAAARRHLAAVGIAEVALPGVAPRATRKSGRFATPCGELRGGSAPLRVVGTIAQLDAGGALRARPCGAELRLPAGTSHLSVPPGRVMRIDHLFLSSHVVKNRRSASAIHHMPGGVLDFGDPGEGRRTGVKLGVHGPATLVLAESFDTGWRASCDGNDLGEPRPVDGFANGWDVQAGCRNVDFEFAPQKVAWIAYAISALGTLLLLLVALVSRRRRTDALAPEPGRGQVLPDPLLRVPWGTAIAIGVAAAAIGAFLFALRAGIVIGPAAVVALRVGVTRRRLLTAAAVGMAAIPGIYLVFPVEDLGGFSFGYALAELGAHWVAVGVVICIGTTCVLAVRALREEGP